MSTRVRLTKAKALKVFKYELKENKAYRAIKGDPVALCEAWNNFVDTLRKDGLVTEEQADTWANPFYKEVTA